MFRRFLYLSLASVMAAGGYLYFINASWLADKSDGNFTIISHRGVYQTYDRTNVGKFDCTATRIYPPTHNYLENTQASISKALELGADVVEIDIRKTADNQLIVFHDNTFDCRTDAKGATEEYTLAQIKTFDVGYGYTADNGQTYPFRGKGIGLILSLAEVLQSFPGTQFLINFKDGRVKAADELVEYLQQHQLLARTKLLVYGNRKTVERLKYLVANAKGGDKTTAKACFKAYMKWGWSGVISDVCHNTYVYAPADKADMLWGWPNRFLQRMAEVNTQVVLMGPMRDGRVHGFYQVDELEHIPQGFNGAVWVEKIEVVGEALVEMRLR